MTITPSYPLRGTWVFKKWYLVIFGGTLGNKNKAFTSVFIAALFTIAKLWKQSTCPMTDEWIKKVWYIHTMECYSVIKKNETMLFAGKWMNWSTSC
jgi:hypothetical protein